MKLIFCLSYLEVPSTVTIIEKSRGENLKIVTSNEKLYKFLSLIYDTGKVILLERQLPLLSLNPFKMVRNIKVVSKIKSRAWKQFKGYEGAEVYFSAVACSEFESWLALKMSKKNTLYYKPEVNLSHLKAKYTLFSLAYILILKIVYGLNLEPLWSGSRYYFSVENNFLRFISEKQFEPDKSVLRHILENKLNIAHKQFLLLVGGIIEEGNVSESEYIAKMDDLICFLYKKYGLDAIALKIHPAYEKVYSCENKIVSIPKYIPANMFFSFFNIIIGYNTAGLFEAANECRIVISLLKYMKPADTNTCQNQINYLKQNTKKQIYFPGDINDIKEILKDIDLEKNNIKNSDKQDQNILK